MNTGLVDHRGNPVSSDQFKKGPAPVSGEKFGVWAGNRYDMMSMPGGGLVQFNLEGLQLSDYRGMLTHYQVNASLSVLSFMQHQSNWTIECDDKKLRDQATEMLTNIWTQLNRSMSQANWAGYGPSVLQWENDSSMNATTITKVKDLTPEACAVNWKFVDGYVDPADGPNQVPPKIPIYDGIRQIGWPKAIPAPNTFWYPILMENGNYWGKKLLKAAYQSYFFSILLHLFANRYYERFGEPTPIGRAPFDDEISLANGEKMNSAEFMLLQLQQLRNRSTVVLPNDRGEDMGRTTAKGYWDYDLEYLESQMRGADFERYMQRLDEEISLSIFTPVLLLQTADVGSYNLGVGHMQMYLWMLNALNGDRAYYIDNYILEPFRILNAGPKAPKLKIKFTKLDNTNSQLIQTVVQTMLGAGKIKPDLDQLGEMSGMKWTEIQETKIDPTQPPPVDPNNPVKPPKPRDKPGAPVPGDPSKNSVARDIRNGIIQRVSSQVSNAHSAGRFNSDFRLSIGFRRRIEDLLVTSGLHDAERRVDAMYSRLDLWAQDMSDLGTCKPEEFTDDFVNLFDHELTRALAA